MTKITAGKYYGAARDGTLVELEQPPREPDVWICRRVQDFPGGRPPAGAATAACCECGELIAYNPARAVAAPKSCMQCNGIEPDPIPPR